MTCADCGKTPKSSRATHRHHVIPKSLGGSDDPKNIVVLCQPCHAERHRHLKTNRKPVVMTEKTTIRFSIAERRLINRLKRRLGFKTASDVIRYLLLRAAEGRPL